LTIIFNSLALVLLSIKLPIQRRKRNFECKKVSDSSLSLDVRFMTFGGVLRSTRQSSHILQIVSCQLPDKRRNRFAFAAGLLHINIYEKVKGLERILYITKAVFYQAAVIATNSPSHMHTHTICLFARVSFLSVPMSPSGLAAWDKIILHSRQTWTHTNSSKNVLFLCVQKGDLVSNVLTIRKNYY